MSEILLGVKPLMQPQPHKNPSGDCFACALKAAIDHLYPERPVNFDAVWNAFKVTPYGGGEKVLSNTWPTMCIAAYALRDQGYDLDVHADIVTPQFEVDHHSHAWFRMHPTMEWAYRLEAWLAAGWLVLVEINYAGAGPYNQDGTSNNADHFVVLDGQRHFWKRFETGGASLTHETHVVCSARGAYWIDTHDLMRKHGVAGLRLIRRDEREYR